MRTENAEPREAAFFTTIRSWGIVRGPEGILGGVIAALGRRVGLAPWPARIIVIIATFLLFPLVMIGYAAGWALLPDAEGNIVIQNFGRGIMNVGALIGIAIFGLVGFFSFADFRPFGRAWFGPDIASVDPGTPFRLLGMVLAVLIPLTVIAGVIALVVWLARKPSAAATASAPGAAPTYALTPQQARAASDSSTEAPAPAPSATVPPAPKAPPAPPTPRVPGPGRGFYFAALAWAFLAAAVVAWGDREDLLSIYPVAAWGMLFLTGLGVILIAISLSGRRLGFLGFLGIAGLLPAVILLAGHEDFLAAYERNGNPADAVVEVVVEPSAFDATHTFAADYDSIFLGGYCFDGADGSWAGSNGSTARIAVADPVTKDVTHEILAATTTVIIPRGTSLEVTSNGFAQAMVYFADRDVTCTFDGFEGTYVSLVNADDPLVTLKVIDDQIANTIIIEEN
jgi:phage shock protein PspC (stress-responsive transcriptional regulator)